MRRIQHHVLSRQVVFAIPKKWQFSLHYVNGVITSAFEFFEVLMCWRCVASFIMFGVFTPFYLIPTKLI